MRFTLSTNYDTSSTWLAVSLVIVYILASMVTIAMFVTINALQGFVLSVQYGIPANQLGSYSGSLVFYDQIASLCAVSLWGILSDLSSRFIIYSVGFALEAVALYFYVRFTNYSPDLILLRLLFAIGGAACSSMLSACLADISTQRDRGKFSGLVGLSSGLGAVLAVSLLVPIPALAGGGIAGLRTAFTVAAGISAGMASVLFVASLVSPPITAEAIESVREEEEIVGRRSGSGSGNYLRDATSEPTSNDHLNPNGEAGLEMPLVKEAWKDRLRSSIQEGLSTFQNPNILLGYVCSFLARGDSLSITLYLPLWIYKYYLQQGLCADPTGDLPTKDNCSEAYLKAAMISGITQVFALAGAPVFGILLDRFQKGKVALLASLLAGLGYTLLAFSPSPLSPLNYLFLFCIGFGEIGLVVSSVTLVTSNQVPLQSRGFVSGISSLFGAVGILVVSAVGGGLFDRWSGGPWLMLGVIHGVFVVGMLVYWSFFSSN